MILIIVLIQKTNFAKKKSGARQMAQWLKVPAALAEALNSVPRTHLVAQNHMQLQF